MTAETDIFRQIKEFIGFTDDDAATLKSLAPVFAVRGGAITDAFYVKLSKDPDQSRLIEGRVDALKATHHRWMGELFAGDYGESYFQNRWKIGMTHVKVGVRPWWVEAVTSFLRSEGLGALTAEIADSGERTRAAQALIKILDIDLMIINLAYDAETVDRLSNFTGMSKKLIERCISLKK